MATALETSSERRTPNPHANLVFASVAGAVYVFAALAVVLYAVPQLWHPVAGATAAGEFNFVSDGVLRTLQLAALAGLVWLGRSLAGANPPKGLRGGIFLVISAVIALFFAIRAIGMNVEGSGGMILTSVVGLGLIFGSVRFFASTRAVKWMVALEHSGFFHATSYKRSLGQRIRRLTILGILILGFTGIYSMYVHGTLGSGNWTLELPFTDVRLTLLTSKQYTVPVFLGALTLWLAFRVVNMPTFAEFLIATEAEMNKVSWSTRRQLTQDTVVVLVTVILMTLFLLFVDLFWGWLLSRTWIGVLPGHSTGQQKAGQVDEVKW